MVTGMFTEEQKKAILDEALESAKEEIVKTSIESLSHSIKYAIQRSTADVVSQWFDDEFREELLAHLASNKELILAATVEAGEQMAILLSKSMVEVAAKNFESSYDRRKILEVMFK